MARVEIQLTAVRTINDVLHPDAGASVQILDESSSPAIVWVDATSGTERGNPLATDTNGRIEGFVDEGEYFAVISPADGSASYTQPIHAGGDLGSIREDLADLQTLVASCVKELAYAETDNDFATSADDEDIPDMEIAVTATGRPLLIVFDANISGDNTLVLGQVKIKEGTTLLASGEIVKASGATIANPFHISARVTPTAGTHTYKVSAGNTTFGNGTLNVVATATLQIFEL